MKRLLAALHTTQKPGGQTKDTPPYHAPGGVSDYPSQVGGRRIRTYTVGSSALDQAADLAGSIARLNTHQAQIGAFAQVYRQQAVFARRQHHKDAIV